MTYLDHAATTPLRPQVRERWLAAADRVGNPSSVHAAGRAARRLVEESREQTGAALGVPADTVVFTAGGTEADNLAVVGGFRARRAQDPDRRVVLISAVEHKAVAEPAAALADEGAVVVTIPVDRSGQVDPTRVKELLAEHAGAVALVAVMWANNEVGTLQPVAELSGVCADFDVPLHVDAVQALGVVPLQTDLATTVALSGHKIGGPPGIGMLVHHRGAALAPLARGGGHESGLRPGTLNTPGIAALAAAVQLAVDDRAAHAAALGELRAHLVAGIGQVVPDAVVNGDPAGHPGIVNVGFPGCEGDALMLLLDAAGIAVSTGSACNVGIPQPSAVLRAMGADVAAARSALRFSFGWTSTPADVDACLAALPGAVQRARRAGALSAPPGAGRTR